MTPAVLPAAGSVLGRPGGCGEEPKTPPPPRPQGPSLGLDVQTLVSRKPSFPTKWAGKSPHLVIAFPRGRSPRCWPPSPPQGPGLQGSNRQRPGCPRELMEGRGWAEEACTGVRGSPAAQAAVEAWTQGRAVGLQGQRTRVLLFPVLFLSLALCPGQQPTCLQGSPPAPLPAGFPLRSPPARPMWEVGGEGLLAGRRGLPKG